MPPVTARTWRSAYGGLLGAGDHAAHDVAVAAEVLGGAVQRHRGAVVERVLQHRGGEGVVDEHGHVAGGGHGGADVEQLQRRVGRGLHDHQRGVGAHGRGDLVLGAPDVTSVPSRPVESRWSVPPYSGRTATTWRLPVGIVRESTAAVIAAMPEANATAVSACSSVASAVSKRATVGFHSRGVDVAALGRGGRRSPSTRRSRRPVSRSGSGLVEERSSGQGVHAEGR